MTKRDETYWHRIERLFHGALELPTGQRRSWVGTRCADAPELAREVLELLASHETEDCRVGRAVTEAAREASGARRSAEGRRLGAYRILERLGQGGMGTVYLAQRDDHAYRQKVAIKLIRGFPGDEALERMRRERQILAVLNHPHIARLLDGGNTDDGQPYLVMEYIDGVPMLQWCREHALNERQRIRLMLSILDAVHYAHQHLVIHRDIKPGNVLVTKEKRPVLLDFGIAKFVSEPGTETVQTARFYTPGYASPEQLAGKPVTTASDVYSLGRLLLAVLEVQDADPAEQQDTVFRRAAWQRKLPHDLAAIAEQATRAEPARRYSSVAALRADLVNYLEGRAVEAVPSRFSYRLGKFLRRHQAAAAACALAVIIGLSLVWQWVGEYERARAAEATASLEAEHARQVLDFMLDTIGAASPHKARGEDITVLEVVEHGQRALLDGPNLDPLLEARLLLALGEVYQHLESFGAADELLQRAADASEPAIRARALSLLGFGRIRQERYEQARPPLQQGLALAETHSDLPVETRLQLHNHWGLLLLSTGDALAAREVFAEVLSAHRQAGDKDLSARLAHNLALAEFYLGNLDRSAELFRESLAIKEETVGRTDPSYASTLQLLSQVLNRQGDFEAARAAITESVESRIALFGEDDPVLHGSYNELANAHHNLGEFDQAIALYRKAADLLKRADARSFSRAIYMNNLASAFEDQGDWWSATPLFRNSLQIRREALGDHHPAVATAAHNLARNLARLGEFEDAERLIDEALQIRSELLGDDHQATHYTRALYGALAYHRGDWASAERIQRHASESLGARLSDTNLWVLRTRGELAQTLIEQGELDEAVSILEETIAGYHQALTASHPDAAALELELARIELLLGQPDRAEVRLTAIAPILEQRLFPGSANIRKLACLRAQQTGRGCWADSH